MFCIKHYGFSGLTHIVDMFLIALDHITLGIFYNLQKHPNNVSVRSCCHVTAKHLSFQENCLK